MRIEHIALWTKDIEKLKKFYITYFGAAANNKYINAQKKFESYFLSFNEGCRLEIMQKPKLNGIKPNDDLSIGLTHLAISVGDKETVLLLTEQLRKDGYKIVGEPRITGDGYFESVVCDPDGNKIEITV